MAFLFNNWSKSFNNEAYLHAIQIETIPKVPTKLVRIGTDIDNLNMELQRMHMSLFLVDRKGSILQ